MTHNITVLDNGTTKIEVDFSDENVNLRGETFVKGGETEALNYLPVFEQDLRRNYSELFPKPDPETMPEEGMM
ncbi:MAG: hypothetical protein PWP75_108 [Caldanaerobacter sp.]|jgi:hypothetical protein|nr:hypothetical protein [Caldanaerobacter sp.]